MAALIRELLIHELLQLPSHQLWTDYDSEADVLYISFRKPQQADDTVMGEDGNLYHYAAGALVGVTILNASCQGTLAGALTADE
ncbi:MAG: DUF2283 domain-containing protein [Anaerolineae bacterium]|nr:DUF2283 domain-containing protein [Anaerolineae bacterium]